MENNVILGNLGYDKKLYILPFDHRSYFEKLDLSHEEISTYKKVIYEGYEKSLALGVPQEESAILVDDAFGLEILLDAKKKNYVILQSTEISGIDHFEFEHTNDWQSWIEKVKPTFTKALVRYNVEGDQEINEKTRAGLRQLSDYSHANGYKFLIEPLVPATDEQLQSVENDKGRYDRELRPNLTVKMIHQLQEAGIEPDVWKIEGMFEKMHYNQVVTAATLHGRKNVGVIALGRNETDEVVETWLKVGAQVPGVIGFAVGRTIFLNALMKLKSTEYSHDQAVSEIAERFFHFYKVFTGK